MICLVAVSVSAFDLRTIFNPFTQKLDYISVYNTTFNTSVADDRYLKLTGGNVTGNINMSGKNITHVDNMLIVDPSEVKNLERTDIAALHIRTRIGDEVGIITSWTPIDWGVPWKENLQIGHVNVTDRTFYERIRMDTKGWLGLLTKSPKDQLDVAGTIRANRTNSTYLISNNVTITKGKLYIDENGILIEQDSSIPGRLNLVGTNALQIKGFTEILLASMGDLEIELWTPSSTRTLNIVNEATGGNANLNVENNITAQNFKGNINASYVQGAPWLTSETGDISAVTATGPGLTGGGTSGALTIGLNDTYINSKWNDTAYALSLLTTTYYNATTITTTIGTPEGTVNDINNYNIASYNISEDSGSLEAFINFTGILSFNNMIFRYKTDAAETSHVVVYFWNYDEELWESLDTLGRTGGVYVIQSVNVFSPINYINDGLVQMKLVNTGTPPNHIWNFEWISISSGVAVPLGDEVDPYSLYYDGSVQLTSNWEVGPYNITFSSGAGVNASSILNAPWSLVDTFNTSADILAASITNHNNLSGLQGGAANEYYHLTSSEYSEFGAIDSTYVPYTGATTDVNLVGNDLINVGILGVGTTELDFPAEIVRSTSGPVLALRSNSIDAGTEVTLRMTTSTDNIPAHHRGEIRVNRTTGPGGGATDMNFYVSDGTAMQRRVQIDSTGNVGIGVSDPTYKLQVAGTSYFTGAVTSADTITGSTVTATTRATVTDWDDYDVTGSQTNKVYTVDASSVAFSPFAATVWHDIAAFNRVSTPQVTRWNGTHWYSDTSTNLVRELFAVKQNQRINILNCASSPTKTRWFWNTTGFSWSDIQWMVAGVSYDSPSPTRRFELQGSTDFGATWTVLLHNSTSTSSAQPYYMKTGYFESQKGLRLTISCVGTSGKFDMTALQFLTKRWGDQGGGSEFSYPYVWNGDRDMTFYGSAVFNENSLDKDFRVESDGNANMLYVDAGNNRVGIGTSSPSTTFDVNGAAKVTTLDTGLGNNELYEMNQNVKTTNNVSFMSVNASGTIVNSSGIYFT